MRYSLLLVLSVFLTSCASWREPEATADATPPPGYAPVFLKTIAPMPEKRPQGTSATITRVDRVDPRVIRVYVHVLDTSGTYYTSATKKGSKIQFCKVSETLDGTPRDVKNPTIREIVETDPDAVSVAIVMDNSGSMGDARARAVQQAVREFLTVKRPQDGIALVRYDDHTAVESALTSDAAATAANLKVNGLEGFGGGTAIHSGINTAIDHLEASSPAKARKAVVVFTDGQENSSDMSREDVIARAIKTGTVVCAVDFGAGINEGYMESISSATGGSYSHIYRTSEFRPMFEDVYRRIRNSYVIEYPVRGYGDHVVNVKLCWGKDTLTATTKYNNTPDVGSIALLNVTFDHGKTTLDGESAIAIANVVSMLKAFPKMTIEVRGHTDNTNSTNDSDFNQKLSQKRAESVRDAIVKQGIDAARISVRGYGDSEPVMSNDDEKGRAANRRTEFKINSR